MRLVITLKQAEFFSGKPITEKKEKEKLFDILVNVTEAGERITLWEPFSKTNFSRGSSFSQLFQMWLKKAFRSFYSIYTFWTPKYNLDPHLSKNNWDRSSSHIDVTHGNASYMVTSNFEVLAWKFEFHKQRRLNAFYSAQDIYKKLSIVLPVKM